MRAALAIMALLASCQAPDRWNTSVSQGRGEIDGPKQDFDTDETTLEVGISGPLWSKPEVRREAFIPAPEIVTVPKPAEPTSTDWIGPVAAAIVAIIGALAGVRYIPSKAFVGPFDEKKA